MSSTSSRVATRVRSSAGAAGTWIVVGILAMVVLAGLGAQAWRRANPRPSRALVAVLPFDNVARDPALEYLAEGLADEIRASLAGLDPARLALVGRSSVMGYKRTVKTAPEIGQELRAHYVLESSIRADGPRLTVVARLVRTRDREELWSRSRDWEPAVLPGVQPELSRAIAESAGASIPPEGGDPLARRQPDSAEAYDLYLRGRHHVRERAPAPSGQAIERFEQAVAVDPEYALAWAALAEALATSPLEGDVAPLEVRARARAAAARALARDARLAESHLAAGLVKLFLDWEWAAAEAAFRRAIELAPAQATAHRMLGLALSHMGRHDEAEAPIRRARELDPLDPVNHAASAEAAFQARHQAAAVGFAKQAIALAPDVWKGYLHLAQGLEALDQEIAALDALEPAVRLSRGHSRPVAVRGYVLAGLGRASEARLSLATLEESARARYVPPSAMALVSAGLGQADAAFGWLERALEAHDVHLISLPADPKWDMLRSDPRFQSLLERRAFTGSVVAPAADAEAERE